MLAGTAAVSRAVMLVVSARHIVLCTRQLLALPCQRCPGSTPGSHAAQLAHGWQFWAHSLRGAARWSTTQACGSPSVCKTCPGLPPLLPIHRSCTAQRHTLLVSFPTVGMLFQNRYSTGRTSLCSANMLWGCFGRSRQQGNKLQDDSMCLFGFSYLLLAGVTALVKPLAVLGECADQHHFALE